MFDKIDWKVERARLEDRFIKEHFPGKKRGELDEGTQKELDLFVDPEIDKLDKRLRSEQVPAAMAAIERQIQYSETVQYALTMVALDPKAITLSLRALIPLDR